VKRHSTSNNLAPTQANIPLTVEDFDDPEKLILVAWKYFVTAFPNERRVDCPAPGVILTARADQSPGDELRAHLFRCSKCFNKYSAAIWDHRRREASGATAAKMKI
jgi:hypothetical protein